MQIVRRKKTSLAFFIAIIGAVLGKRKHPKASLICLFKRLLGWLAARVLTIPTPQIVSGRGSSLQIARVLKGINCSKPLVVTDKDLVKHGIVQPVLDSLSAEGLKAEVYDGVVPNPPSELVEEGHAMYKRHGCDSIVAVGGGSPMDVAKVIGAKVGNPMPDVAAYQGYFLATWVGLRPIPPLIAVPTTAGTGSETTVAAVITLKERNQKIAIADLGLVPRVAVLDPQLLVKLPKGVTSATGMDALTHAVESYLGAWSSAYSRRCSLGATGKIFKHLVRSWEDGADIDAREGMLNASFEAGLAFTRAHVGYVHAIAHQFGGMFHTAHGVANAMLLPHVLEYYIRDEAERNDSLPCSTKYCELAIAAGLAPGVSSRTCSASEKRVIARKFIDSIVEMNRHMTIPSEVKEMKASDIDEVARRAIAEAHGCAHSFMKNPLYAALDLGYPVPKYMTHDECKGIIALVLPADEKVKFDALGK